VQRRTQRQEISTVQDAAKDKSRGSPKDLLRLLSYAKPYRARLAIALLSLIIAGGLALAFPQVVRLLINAAFVERDSAKLNRLALLLVGVFATQAGFSFLRTYLLSYTGERIVADVRTELYNHLTTLTVNFFANRRVGELTSRLTSDVTVVQTVTTGSIAELLRSSLLLVGGVTIHSHHKHSAFAFDACNCSGCDRGGAFVRTLRSALEH
jgi:ATP-binding cassette, subfamily B, bacterial MsbA